MDRELPIRKESSTLFVTTKTNGMGIGLAVSRSIVEAHGGRLWAENNPAGHATFNVPLPVSPVVQTFDVS
jgi:signal transduction histidine kinase